MSRMSSGALNEMCSYRSSDEKIIHFNNILRFAILKKDHSFMAIGGPWNGAINGGDPSVEDSPLIQTARRYLKDITQLDLQNCQHWNRFLEDANYRNKVDNPAAARVSEAREDDDAVDLE